ncbi:MAG: hypothetical protein JO048_05665, partial [Methylobacteriaceae bacterium]|nr:hypothetical protein [Methylobacteriaceae bacterium]
MLRLLAATALVLAMAFLSPERPREAGAPAPATTFAELSLRAGLPAVPESVAEAVARAAISEGAAKVRQIVIPPPPP